MYFISFKCKHSCFKGNKAEDTIAQINGISQPRNTILFSLSDNHFYLDYITFMENTGCNDGRLKN